MLLTVWGGLGSRTEPESLHQGASALRPAAVRSLQPQAVQARGNEVSRPVVATNRSPWPSAVTVGSFAEMNTL